MKKFFSNKYNIILIVAIVLCCIFVGISTAVDALIPVSLFLIGSTCFYIAYLFVRKKIDSDRTKVSDFIDPEEKIEKKKQSFLEQESKANILISITAFALFGLVFFYIAIKML